MSKDDDATRPTFPRRRWFPGQTEQAQEPQRGGTYDRCREKDEADQEIDEALDDKQP